MVFYDRSALSGSYRVELVSEQMGKFIYLDWLIKLLKFNQDFKKSAEQKIQFGIIANISEPK